MDSKTRKLLKAKGMTDEQIDAILEESAYRSAALDMQGIAHKSAKEADQQLDPASYVLSKMFGGNQPKKRKSKKQFGNDPAGIILGHLFE